MPTNTVGSTARLPTQQQVSYLRKTFDYTTPTGTVLTVGILPAGATMIRPISGVQTNVVFNAGTANTVDVGIVGTAAKYSSASSIAAIAHVPNNVTAVSQNVTVDTTIIATVTLSGTAATTGSGEIYIAYMARS